MPTPNKERGFIAYGHEVRSILASKQTQFRRVVKPQPPAATLQVSTWHHPDDFTKGPHFWSWGPDPMNPGQIYIQPDLAMPCPYGQPSDRLWVREAWAIQQDLGLPLSTPQPLHYLADILDRRQIEDYTGKPSIHMPRWASRIALEIVSVRVERLQYISEADAIAEGAGPYLHPVHPSREGLRHVDGFARLWRSINAANRPSLPKNPNNKRYARVKNWLDKHPDIYGWEANPWVWVVEFKRVTE